MRIILDAGQSDSPVKPFSPPNLDGLDVLQSRDAICRRAQIDPNVRSRTEKESRHRRRRWTIGAFAIFVHRADLHDQIEVTTIESAPRVRAKYPNPLNRRNRTDSLNKGETLSPLHRASGDAVEAFEDAMQDLGEMRARVATGHGESIVMRKGTDLFPILVLK
ncbi:hypothetical protein D3C81_1021180 [compost metagenome]